MDKVKKKWTKTKRLKHHVVCGDGVSVIARLNKQKPLDEPNNFYLPSQFSTRSVIESLSS